MVAALQTQAVPQPGNDRMLGPACRDMHMVEMPLAAMDEKQAISRFADTGSFQLETAPLQRLAHKGETDENGCHKDKYGRRHCHKKQKQ